MSAHRIAPLAFVAIMTFGCGGESSPSIDAGALPDASELDAFEPGGDASELDGSAPPDGDHANDSGPADAGELVPLSFEVIVAADAPMGVMRAAEHAHELLGLMGRTATLVPGGSATPRACEPGRGRVVLLGDAIPLPSGMPAASQQAFSIHETRCGDGVLVELSGGGLLGRQYAVYEWLHAIGVRFFHPEDRYVPAAPRWPAAPVHRDHVPSFQRRSVSLHLTHPLELGDAFRLNEPEHELDGVRYIDWQIANGASRGHGGIGTGQHATYGIDRGLPREAGFGLHSSQQGGRPIIDPDDPRSEEEQLAAAIDERLGDAATRAEFFGFTFNPTEFTEIPHEDAIRQITFITNYITQSYPGVEIETTNHGTHQEPGPRGVRFFDLPQFAPPALGVKVHTLMFYDLYRDAPVYGNDNFHFLREFIERESQVRRITYFPESAWWLTFDNAVPLYLPITIEARDRDIQGLRPLLTQSPTGPGLIGHHVFGSGHEWGYWQNEYCSYRMAMDVEYRWTDCVADIVSPMGSAGMEVQAVIEDVVELQARDFVDHWEDTLAYLVGTDAETEVAFDVGIVFHPLPPTPRAIMGWDMAQLDAWDSQHLPALRRMDMEYDALVDRLRAVSAQVPADGRRFFDEILDGVEVTGLRARHAWQVYGAVVRARRAALTGDAAIATESMEWLADAIATTTAARAVITRREAGYRYRPLDRAIAGGPDLDEDDNWTVYRYRYLGRTHQGFYWTRIDRLAEEAITGTGDAVEISDVLLGPGQPLVIDVLDRELTMVSIDFGDGTPALSGVTHAEHSYGSTGSFDLAVSATRGVDPFSLAGPIASVVSEVNTNFTANIVAPPGVDLIESVLPGLVIGPLGDGRIAVGFSARRSGEVQLGQWVALTPRAGTTMALETEPITMQVPVINRGTASITTTLAVENAVVSQASAGASYAISGRLVVEAIIDAVVVVSNGALNEMNARGVVASFLGATPDTLPTTVEFRVEYPAP